ncbi:HlyD family secretion protein [Alishewanella sp. HH-ZS]|uniref:HlyD family secretion protein n=1 Tax=Alishewanella sp. HH-ZS TaxID=1856684 RepID=UPI0011474C4E|nr:HlyD family efflux transporter periplasmic adaptor subunit [Alishewanella sp. HH-ZS]
MGSIFRQESINKQRTKLFGVVFLDTPIKYSLIVTLFVFIFICLLLVLIFGEYTKKERAIGLLSPENGLVRVMTSHNGIVEQVHIRQGQKVNKGDALFSIKSDTAINLNYEYGFNLIDSLESEKRELEKIIKLTVDSTSLNLANLESEGNQVAGEIDLLYRRLLIQKKILSNKREVYESANANRSAISRVDLTLLEGEYYEAEQSVEHLKHQIFLLKSKIESIKRDSSLARIAKEITNSENKKTLRNIEQRILQAKVQSNYVITAPLSGTVASITTFEGQNVSVNKQIMTLTPSDDDLIAHIFIPSRAVGFIRENQKVRISYDSFPYQKHGFFNGEILSISKSAINSSDIEYFPAVTEKVFLARVRLEQQEVTINNENFTLQPGMSLSVDIDIEKQKLWEWLLNPILKYRI